MLMATKSLIIRITLLATIFSKVLSLITVKPSIISPLNCSTGKIQTCDALLYHISVGLTTDQIASYYSVNTSRIKPIDHNKNKDYLVSVPCGCQNVNGTTGYFYNTSYAVLEGDTFEDVTTKIYSGQVWKVGDGKLVAGTVVPFHLACGCVEENSQVVVTYTVQEQDTLSGIATSLSAKIDGIERLNMIVAKNPSYIDVGWVLLIPMEKNGIQPPKGVCLIFLLL